MMVLQDGINAIYQSAGMSGKIYWSATEESDGPASPTTSQEAWVVDFTQNSPAVYPARKNDIPIVQGYKLRCVSDY